MSTVPDAPTTGQAATGVVFFVVLAAIFAVFLRGESDAGNRTFLVCSAGLCLLMAAWRGAYLRRALKAARYDAPGR